GPPATGQERRPFTLEGQGGVGRRSPVRRLSQRGRGPQGRRRPGGDRGGAAGATPPWGQGAGGQQGLPPVSEWGWPGAPPDRRGEGGRGRPLRRQVGATDQHRSRLGRGGLTVQATLDGRAVVPVVQVAVTDPPDLPQV